MTYNIFERLITAELMTSSISKQYFHGLGQYVRSWRASMDKKMTLMADVFVLRLKHARSTMRRLFGPYISPSTGKETGNVFAGPK